MIIKRIFIAFSEEDRTNVNHFISILKQKIKDANLSEAVTIISMDNFSMAGGSELSINASEINKADIFLMLVSPFFLKSLRIQEYEYPLIQKITDGDRDKKVFYIKLNDIKGYDSPNFMSTRQFYKSASASSLDFFCKDCGPITENLKEQYVEELVSLMEPFITTNKGKFIERISEIPHVDDFIKGVSRDLRVCKSTDPLLIAEFIMCNIFPPIRHLLVLNNEDQLDGVISMRDILKFGFSNNMRRDGNLTTLNDSAKNKLVSELYTSRDNLVFKSLDVECLIEDLMIHFVKSPDIGKPIGVVPIIKRRDTFDKGSFELISYIDILSIWKKLRIGRELEKLSAESFAPQTSVVEVSDTDSIVTATSLINRGLRTVPVVDSNKKLVGIVSDYDLLGIEAKKAIEPISSIMCRNVKSISFRETTSFSNLIKTFLTNKKYTSLPVINSEGSIIKMIGYTDLINRMREMLADSQKNL